MGGAVLGLGALAVGVVAAAPIAIGGAVFGATVGVVRSFFR